MISTHIFEVEPESRGPRPGECLPRHLPCLRPCSSPEAQLRPTVIIITVPGRASASLPRTETVPRGDPSPSGSAKWYISTRTGRNRFTWLPFSTTVGVKAGKSSHLRLRTRHPVKDQPLGRVTRNRAFHFLCGPGRTHRWRSQANCQKQNETRVKAATAGAGPHLSPKWSAPRTPPSAFSTNAVS